MKSIDKPMESKFPEDVSKERNRDDKSITFAVDADTSLRDFYWKYSRGQVPYDTTKFAQHVTRYDEPMDDATKQKVAGKQFYELQFTNKGGMVMPIIIEWTYKDGSKEVERIPAQIWRKDDKHLTKVFMKDKEVASIRLDPNRETADIDESNNSWPVIQTESKFQVFKAKQQALRSQPQTNNPMQKAQEKDKKAF
jgi:hypothetical protein